MERLPTVLAYFHEYESIPKQKKIMMMIMKIIRIAFRGSKITLICTL